MSWGVEGHEWAENLLRGHIRRGDVHHAYLLSGPPGVGKRTLALRFIQALNCPNPPEPGQPCLQPSCRSCRLIGEMQHPDLNVMQAQSEGEILKLEQIRPFMGSINLMPYESKYRAGLLLRFEEANNSVQNALLKTLEEPPARAILILTASSPDALLPTIQSRCEVLRLRPLKPEVLRSSLQRRGIAVERAELLARYSGGRLGAALRMDQDADLLERRSTLLEDAFELLGSPLRARFAYAESLARARAGSGEGFGAGARRQTREAYLVWLSMWRDVFLAASAANLPQANPDCQEQIAALAGAIGSQAALQQALWMTEALERLDRNVNPRLLSEVTLMRWPRLEMTPG